MGRDKQLGLQTIHGVTPTDWNTGPHSQKRTGELKEAVQVKLSELEPVIDKQHIDEISERVKNDRYEALTEIPDLLANGIRAESEKLVEKI